MKNNTPMTVKEGWFCYQIDCDCEEPYMILANKDALEEERISIPEEVAYYLRTHFCGSQKMHDLIESHAVASMQNKLKEILGIN